MKKVYSEPEILFDDFSLNENIAAACVENVHTQYTGVCGVPMGKKTIFLTNVSGCAVKVTDGDPLYNGWCYHIPVENTKLFNS